jgi:hypothetical protein
MKETSVLFLLFCLALNPLTSMAQTDNISIIQGDSTYKLSPQSHSILLERKPFIIRTKLKKYKEKKQQYNAIQMAVRNTNAGMCQAGQIISDVLYFAPGTGMATDSENKYPFLFINNEAHHYFTYQNKPNKRVNPAEIENGYVLAEIPVSGFHYNDSDIQIEGSNLTELFIDILINRNLNQLIDQGELTQIHLRFH